MMVRTAAHPSTIGVSTSMMALPESAESLAALLLRESFIPDRGWWPDRPQEKTTLQEHAANALGRRLNRMRPWISRSESEVAEFTRLFAIYRKPKQRGVAGAQHKRPAGRNSESLNGL